MLVIRTCYFSCNLSLDFLCMQINGQLLQPQSSLKGIGRTNGLEHGMDASWTVMRSPPYVACLNPNLICFWWCTASAAARGRRFVSQTRLLIAPTPRKSQLVSWFGLGAHGRAIGLWIGANGCPWKWCPIMNPVGFLLLKDLKVSVAQICCKVRVVERFEVLVSECTL